MVFVTLIIGKSKCLFYDSVEFFIDLLRPERSLSACSALSHTMRVQAELSRGAAGGMEQAHRGGHNEVRSYG